MRSQSKGQLVNSGTSTEQAIQDQRSTTTGKIGAGGSIRAMPQGNRYKPWPGRKVNEVEVVARNLSSIPNYLNQLETGDTFQDKALKFRVLDWGHLEKLTYIHKQVGDRRGGDSPSSSNASSSPFSTVGSFSQSDRSIGSPLTPMNNSLNSNVHQNSSAEVRWTRMNEQRSVQVPVPDSRTPQIEALVGQNCERGKSNDSDMKRILCNTFPPPNISNSLHALKDIDSKMKAQIGRSIKEDNFENREKLRFNGNKQHLGENGLEGQLLRDESMLGHLEQSAHERCICHDFATNDRRFIVDKRNFSGQFTRNNIQLTKLAPLRSSSCQISSASQSDEPSVSRSFLSQNEMLISNAKAKLGKHGRVSGDMSQNKSVKVSSVPIRDLSPQRLLRAGLNRIRSSSITENSHDDSSASSRKGRRSSSPQRLISAGLNLLRNSSLREALPKGKVKEALLSGNSHEDHASTNNRSRQSPLRRIFDPLKPQNQTISPGPVTSVPSHRALGSSNRDELLIRDQLQAANVPAKSSEIRFCPLSSQVSDAGCSLHTERQLAPTRQALLKLTWKNGLPVFVFSSSDISILSATMGKKTISQTTDSKCAYTIVTAHELKKKGGVWTNQINKSKKHDLAYNVVGQMKVSSYISESMNNCSVREFVLFNVEQISLTNELASQCEAEAAAIVVRVPNDRPENHNCKELRSSGCGCGCSDSSVKSSQMEQKNQKPNIASIVAIIPGGVHGVSAAGKPSPLIERWKSGGSCDCGGWDEGCMLTVLTDKVEESKSSNSMQICGRDGGQRTELFAQVGGKGNRHAFSMIAFQEGVYTVDFGTSVSTVQAFAICIAILHNRKPPTLSELRYSADIQDSDEQIVSNDTSSQFANT